MAPMISPFEVIGTFIVITESLSKSIKLPNKEALYQYSEQCPGLCLRTIKAVDFSMQSLGQSSVQPSNKEPS